MCAQRCVPEYDMVAGLGVSHDITEALHNHGGQLKQEAGLRNVCVWGRGVPGRLAMLPTGVGVLSRPSKTPQLRTDAHQPVGASHSFAH